MPLSHLTKSFHYFPSVPHRSSNCKLLSQIHYNPQTSELHTKETKERQGDV